MRKSKSSESQIVSILNNAEGGIAGADLLRKPGISMRLLERDLTPDDGARRDVLEKVRSRRNWSNSGA